MQTISCEKNVHSEPLVDPKYFLPIYVKLTLVNNFINGRKRERQVFKYLRDFFSRLSDVLVKVKEHVIFVEP